MMLCGSIQLNGGMWPACAKCTLIVEHNKANGIYTAALSLERILIIKAQAEPLEWPRTKPKVLQKLVKWAES